MNVFLIEPDENEAARLLRELSDAGYVVHCDPAAAGPRATVALDACLVSLSTHADEALDSLGASIQRAGLRRLPLLFVGRDEQALKAARKRYPFASFARPDQVLTSLASIAS